MFVANREHVLTYHLSTSIPQIGLVWKDVDTLGMDAVKSTLDSIVTSSIGLRAFCDSHYQLAGATLTQVYPDV